MSDMTPLTAAQIEILEFERLPWKYQGAKDAAILERFDITPTRYAARLNQIIDLPAAEVYDPVTVRRLRRLRTQRQAQRQRPLGGAAAGGAR